MPNFDDDESGFKPSLIGRFCNYVKMNLLNTLMPIREFLAQRKENKQARNEMREHIRESRRRSWPQSFQDKIFMFLDYDPTNGESGVTVRPSILGAIAQWSYRVLWTRRVEILGFVLVLGIGAVCYYAVNNASNASNSPRDRVESQSTEVTNYSSQ